MRSSSWCRNLAGLVTVIGVLGLAADPPPRAQTAAPLFSVPAPQADASDARAQAPARRSRRLLVNGVVLRALMQAGGPERPAVTLNLFPDVQPALVRERLEVAASGHTTWVGHVPGDPQSTVALTWDGRNLSGGVATAAGAYELVPTADGATVVSERDFTPPVELEPIEPPRPVGARERAAAGGGFDAPLDTARIDVLLLYTPAARVKVGGASQIQSQMANAIAVTNTAFQRSGIDAVLNAVSVQELPYTEGSSLSNDLAELAPGGTWNDAMEAARAALGADLVALVTGRASASGGCGIAYLGPYSTYAFSVTEQACLYSGQWSFSHELGHNFGARHAPGDSSDTTPVCPTYACAYREGTIRTLMAYYVSGSAMSRILNFSSASVLEAGLPTGNSLRDNARKIRETAAAVAAYRAGGGGPGEPTAPSGLHAAVDGASAQLTWTPAGGATAHRLQVGIAPGDSSIHANLPTQSNGSHVLVNLTPRTYYWRVRGSNAAGFGPFSPEGSFVVAPPAGPGVPRQFAAWANGATVTLSWLAPASGGQVTGYALEAGSAPGLANVVVATLGGSPATFTGVPLGTYYLRLRAVGPAGRSAPTPDAVLTVAGCVPPGPIGLTGQVAGAIVTLSMTTPTSGTTPVTYVVGAGRAPGAIDVGVFRLGAPGMSVAAPPGVYFVKAAATNACGMSPISNEVRIVVP